MKMKPLSLSLVGRWRAPRVEIVAERCIFSVHSVVVAALQNWICARVLHLWRRRRCCCTCTVHTLYALNESVQTGKKGDHVNLCKKKAPSTGGGGDRNLNLLLPPEGHCCKEPIAQKWGVDSYHASEGGWREGEK